MHLTPVVISLHQLLIPSPDSTIQDADEAVKAAEQMVQITRSIHLKPTIVDSLTFEHATLTLFAQLKRFMFDLLSPHEIQELTKQIHAYQRHYPQHYDIPELSPPKSRRKPPRSLLTLLIRDVPAYRKRDRALLTTSPAQAQLVRLYLRRSKSRLADQSMGFEVLFK